MDSLKITVIIITVFILVLFIGVIISIIENHKIDDYCKINNSKECLKYCLNSQFELNYCLQLVKKWSILNEQKT